MSIEHGFCKACQEPVSFMAGDDGSWACISCGYVDQIRTNQRNLKATIDGSTLDEGAWQDRGLEEREPRYQSERDLTNYVNEIILRWVFRYDVLGCGEALHALLGDADNSNAFVKRVRDLFVGFRKSDSKAPNIARKGFSSTRNRSEKHAGPSRESFARINRRLPYQIAAAIRFAVAENNLILVYTVLGRAGEDTFPHVLRGRRAFANGALPQPKLEAIHERIQSAELSEGNTCCIEDLPYLRKLFHYYTRVARRPTAPIYAILSNLIFCVARLREIAECTDDKIRSNLLVYKSRLRVEKRFLRHWRAEDFEYFRQDCIVGNWDKIVITSYNLYRAQQCVELWGTSCSYAVAIPLLLWGITAIAREAYPYNPQLMAELAAQDGQAHYTTAGKWCDMRRFICAWTASIEDVGLDVPTLAIPQKGYLGDGLSGWNGDRRRGVPESEIAAAAAETIALHWKEICKYRYQTRINPVPYEEELKYARRLLVHHSIDHRTFARLPNGMGPMRKLRDQYDKERAEEDAMPAWYIDDDPDVTFEAGPMIRLDPPNPDWYPVILRTESEETRYISTQADQREAIARAHERAQQREMGRLEKEREIEERYAALEKRDERDELEEMLQKADTSDEEETFSSDDDAEGSSMRVTGIVTRWNRRQRRQPRMDTAISTPLLREVSEVPSYSGSEIERSLRIPSPSTSVSTLHSISSALPLSRTDSSTSFSSEYTPALPLPLTNVLRSDWTPKASRDITEESAMTRHVGLLQREREEIVLYSLTRDRRTGQVVSLEVEAYLNDWIKRQIQNGSMPKKITGMYLASIGLRDKLPVRDDIGAWVRTQAWRWSPLEAVLRAGIQPRALPAFLVPTLLGAKMALGARVTLPSSPMPYIDAPSIPPSISRMEEEILEREWLAAKDDDFPIFFPHHEQFEIGEADDVLFDEEEMEGYLATEEEVERLTNDEKFMAMIRDLDENGNEIVRRAKSRRGAPRNGKVSSRILLDREAEELEAAALTGQWDQLGLEMGRARDDSTAFSEKGDGDGGGDDAEVEEDAEMYWGPSGDLDDVRGTSVDHAASDVESVRLKTPAKPSKKRKKQDDEDGDGAKKPKSRKRKAEDEGDAEGKQRKTVGKGKKAISGADEGDGSMLPPEETQGGKRSPTKRKKRKSATSTGESSPHAGISAEANSIGITPTIDSAGAAGITAPSTPSMVPPSLTYHPDESMTPDSPLQELSPSQPGTPPVVIAVPSSDACDQYLDPGSALCDGLLVSDDGLDAQWLAPTPGVIALTAADTTIETSATPVDDALPDTPYATPIDPMSTKPKPKKNRLPQAEQDARTLIANKRSKLVEQKATLMQFIRGLKAGNYPPHIAPEAEAKAAYLKQMQGEMLRVKADLQAIMVAAKRSHGDKVVVRRMVRDWAEELGIPEAALSFNLPKKPPVPRKKKVVDVGEGAEEAEGDVEDEQEAEEMQVDEA